ncbi:MAG: hypothetical protein J0L75_14600 [Spirochaetes bacterium]|nr:hypothetical protein [Spirochaetota bacterium]
MRRLSAMLVVTAALTIALPAQSNSGSNSLFRYFSDFAETPRLFREADPEVEKRDYEVIKAIISNVENENMRFLFMVLTNERSVIDFHVRRYTQPMAFSNTTYYYDSATRTMRKNDYLRQSIGESERAWDRFSVIKSNLILAGVPESDVNKTEFRLKRLSGVMMFLDGSPMAVRTAVDKLESIIDQVAHGVKDMANNDELAEVYTYLVSASHQVYADTANGDRATALAYLRKELYYLWRYTEMKNAGNEKLKEAKLMEVTRQYYPIMDLEGNQYINVYKPFVEKLGKNYVAPGSTPAAASSTNR